MPHEQYKWARWCGVLVGLFYFIRGTVFAWYLPVPFVAWIALNVLAVTVAAGVAIMGGGSWRPAWVFVLVTFAASLTQAEQFRTSLSRWTGLALLMLAVGPVVLNPVAVAIRSAAWKLVVNGFTVLTAIFVGWYVLHLPCPAGRAPFAGFMNQSMILGPIAGMGVVIAAARALWGNTWRWGLVAVLGLIPLLASGSRVATLAAGVAGCYLLLRRKPILGAAVVLVFVMAVGHLLSGGEGITEGETVGGSLSLKGMVNTRAELWESRVAEFKSSPVFGIGVAMGTGSGSAKDSDGSIRVEPGSSYLAILAMTGTLGAIAFFSALGLAIHGFATARQIRPLERDILSVAGIFLAVHGVAEGWILGFGSPLCFLFWLWLGNFTDAAHLPFSGRAKARGRSQQRFARTAGDQDTTIPNKLKTAIGNVESRATKPLTITPFMCLAGYVCGMLNATVGSFRCSQNSSDFILLKLGNTKPLTADSGSLGEQPRD